MRTSNLLLTFFSLAFVGLAACSESQPSTTTSSGGTSTGGSTTTGGATSGGITTGGGTSTTGGSSSTGGDAGLPGLGLPCNPTVAPDPCTNYFLGCDANPADFLPDGGSTCQLPIEQSACDPAIGCRAGTPALHCVGGFGAGMSPNTCVFYCDSTLDCPTAVTSCQAAPSGSQQVCLYDFCGPGTIAGGQYYAPCSSAGTGDSTCDPLVRLSSTTDLGICDQGGSAALWQACTFTRGPGGSAATLCAQNSTCVPYASPNGLRQFCAPVCNPPGSLASGPSCATGQTCLPFASPDFGICLTDCGGGLACPGSLVCQTLQISATQTIQECLVN